MSGVSEFVKDIVVALIPQREQAESSHVYHWRQTAAVGILLNGGILMLYILWTAGFFAFAGATGFASAADVKTQGEQLRDIRVTLIENAIRAAKAANCIAQREGNMLALKYSSDDLANKLAEYFTVTGHGYPRVPECAELLAAIR